MPSGTQSVDNRILFPGNPWPNGHAIKQFRWSAELTKDAQVCCHLHLESENYNASNPEVETESDIASNWESKKVWNNYGECTLSSSQWDNGGFVVGTPQERFDLDSMSGYSFEVDSLPFNLDDHPSFGIYCQGHDTVAGHQIFFEKGEVGWTIDWSARIALTYLGGQKFDYQLVARKTGVFFDGIAVGYEVSSNSAADLLKRCVVNPERYKLKTTEFGSHFHLAPG